jgi:hypothetical protein
VYPAEQPKLLLKVPSLKRGHETDKANSIQHKADEPMLVRQHRQIGINKYDVLFTYISASLEIRPDATCITLK